MWYEIRHKILSYIYLKTARNIVERELILNTMSLTDKAAVRKIFNIYREMYKNASPSVNFNKLCNNGTVRKDDFFRDYYLSDDKQNRILEKHIRKLDNYNKQTIRNTVMLGCSPTMNGDI